MNNILDDLFFKYRADKTPRIKHNYADTYFDLFKDRRETVKNVLEIGTAEGASLFAWRDFFPNAQIWGGEIDQKRIDLMKDQERITVYQCNQSSIDSLHNLLFNLMPYQMDLVIDDGSHKSSDQILTCLTLMPFLNKDVTYIIEDVSEPDIASIIAQSYSVQKLKVGNRYDDRLVIVRHKIEEEIK